MKTPEKFIWDIQCFGGGLYKLNEVDSLTFTAKWTNYWQNRWIDTFSTAFQLLAGYLKQKVFLDGNIVLHNNN